MAKLTGSSNYKVNEVRRLLALVAKYLPLVKDEWERLASHFNANRGRGVCERDYEILRRKFKVLYSTRKPTGVQEMPPYIKEAMLLKKAIDDKANVVIMDDGGDEDDGCDADEEEEQDEQPDVCFEFNGYESFDHETCTDDRGAVSGTGGDNGTCAEFTSGSTASDDSVHSDETSGFGADSSGTSATQPADRVSDSSDLLDSAAVNEGLEAFASTPRPAPVTMRSSPRLRSAGLKKTAKAPPVADPRRSTTTTATSGSSGADKASDARTRGQEVTCTRDQQEAQRYPKLANSSSRLGGGNLANFRDTVGRKHAYEEAEGSIEASYANAKRARAAKATAALKKRLSDLESSANTMGGNIFEMLLMMREENERKAEARRMEEEQRRRDELAAREVRYLADKVEAEERRRHEKLEIEERARRDKEEVRARTQELMLLIGALTKKDRSTRRCRGCREDKNKRGGSFVTFSCSKQPSLAKRQPRQQLISMKTLLTSPRYQLLPCKLGRGTLQSPSQQRQIDQEYQS